MMTQSVMTQAANLFGNAVGSVTTKGKQTGTGFEMMINNSLKSIQNSTGNTETAVKKSSMPKTEKAKVTSDNDGSVTDQAGNVQNNSVTETSKQAQTEVTQKADSNGTKQTKVTESNEPEENAPDEQLVAQISTLLQTVQQTIMDALNLTSEEFGQLLNDQGMSLTDLLQPENLQQFILASQGANDITAVLTDENLAASMNDLLKSVEELQTKADLGLTTDQIKAILAKIDQGKAASQEETTPLTEATDGKVATEGKKEKQTEAVNTVKTAATEAENDNSKADTVKANAAQNVETESMADTNAGSQSGKGQDKQKDQAITDPFQMFIDNMVKTSKESQLDFGGNLVQVTELRNIANQIIDRIKVSVTTNHTSMELQLNPENLGKVNLTVESKNGVMTAQFVVQNEISKEAIESQLSTLRETLNSQGIKVEAIEVTVSSYAFDQNSKEGQNNNTEAKKENSGKKITLEEAMNMTDTPTEESSADTAMNSLGSQIDYTA